MEVRYMEKGAALTHVKTAQLHKTPLCTAAILSRYLLDK